MISLDGYKPIEQLRADEGRTVVRAESPDGTGPVAIKVLRLPWLSQPEARRSASETIERWRRIAHQGFVVPLRAGWSQDGLVLISPFIVAGSLEDRVREQTLSSLDVRQLAAEISDALRHAHARGLNHGNLKPSNILFDEEGHIHITDFFLGGPTEGNGSARGGQGENGSDYTAPEVKAGGLPTAASDQYSLALVLLTVLSHKTPTLALDWLRKAATSTSGAPKATTRDSLILPSRVVSAFGRALQTTPRERFPSLEAFHREFEYGMGFATEPRPSPDRPPALATPRGGRPQPRRTAILASALALIACLAISVPVLSSTSVGGSLLDGLLRGEQREQTSISPSETPYASAPTVPGSSDLQIGDQNAVVQTSEANLPLAEPSNTPGESSPQDPGNGSATTAPLSPPATTTATATVADSPTPTATQAPASPTAGPEVNPRSCNSDRNHPRYCTPTPTP